MSKWRLETGVSSLRTILACKPNEEKKRILLRKRESMDVDARKRGNCIIEFEAEGWQKIYVGCKD